jgi:hypothetical protein
METSFLRKIVYRAQNLDGEFGEGRDELIGELTQDKLCTAQEFVIFAKLKIFCQKILGILGWFFEMVGESGYICIVVE